MLGEPESRVDQDADVAGRVLKQPGPQLVGYIDPVGIDTDDLRLGDLAAALARVAMRGKASRALSVKLAGSREFTITADKCTGISLGPRTRCTVTVKFTPARAGTVTAALRAV